MSEKPTVTTELLEASIRKEIFDNLCEWVYTHQTYPLIFSTDMPPAAPAPAPTRWQRLRSWVRLWWLGARCGLALRIAPELIVEDEDE